MFHRADNFLKLKANSKKTIAKMRFTVNMKKFTRPFLREVIGTIKTAPNQPADKLTNKSEIVENQIGSILFINSFYKRIQQKSMVYKRQKDTNGVYR